MFKKFLFLLIVVSMVMCSVALVTAGDTKVGGNLKFFLFDKSEGTSRISGTDYNGNSRAIAGFNSLYLFFSKEINDKITIDVEPKVSASTGATPKMGSKIGAQLVGSPEATVGFVRAQITTKLPYQVELTAGMMRPTFTEDYGPQTWYEEEFNGNKVSSNGDLGASDEVGIELYRNFEVNCKTLGAVSIPSYLYLVNGSGNRFTDNNQGKAIMIHLAPEIGDFKVMGSVFTGTWDTDDKYNFLRYSGGFGFEKGKFMFRTELMGGNWENKIAVGTDYNPVGYYVKAAYKIMPWMRGLIAYSHYDKNLSTTLNESYTQISPIINLYASSESIIYLQYDITTNGKSDNLTKIDYNRFMVGWRTTY